MTSEQSQKTIDLAIGVRVTVNPSTLSQALIDLRLPPDFLSAGNGILRVLANLDTQNIYVWSAGNEVHADIARDFGIKNFAGGMGTSVGCGLEDRQPDGSKDRETALYACQERVRSLFKLQP